MKMHRMIAPTGLVLNANGVSRLNGFVPATDRTATPVNFRACPSPSGRSRRF